MQIICKLCRWNVKDQNGTIHQNGHMFNSEFHVQLHEEAFNLWLFAYILLQERYKWMKNCKYNISIVCLCKVLPCTSVGPCEPKTLNRTSIAHTLLEYHHTTIKAHIFTLVRECECTWVVFKEVIIIKFIHPISIGAIWRIIAKVFVHCRMYLVCNDL